MTGKDVVERLLDKFADQDTIDLRAIGDEVATLIDQAQAPLREALYATAVALHLLRRSINDERHTDWSICPVPMCAKNRALCTGLTSVDSKEE